MAAALAAEVSSRLQAAVTPALGAALRTKGWAVANNVFEGETAAALRGEMEALHAAGALHPNATHLVGADGTTKLLQKVGECRGRGVNSRLYVSWGSTIRQQIHPYEKAICTAF